MKFGSKGIKEIEIMILKKKKISLWTHVTYVS